MIFMLVNTNKYINQGFFCCYSEVFMHQCIYALDSCNSWKFICKAIWFLEYKTICLFWKWNLPFCKIFSDLLLCIDAMHEDLDFAFLRNSVFYVSKFFIFSLHASNLPFKFCGTHVFLIMNYISFSLLEFCV